MWLERFGTVSEVTFYVFCAVVCLIFVLCVVNSILECCCKLYYKAPGRSLSLMFIYSSVPICAAVLFRGIQPKWGTIDVFQPLCQVFTALMLIGYTLYTSTLMVMSWAFIIADKRLRKVPEWIYVLLILALLTISGVCVIIWEVVCTPGVSISASLTAQNIFSQNVYECHDLGSSTSSVQQFGWRVAFSVYFALFLLLAVISVPWHCTFSVDTEFAVRRGCLLFIIVNATCSVIVALIVWFQYHPPLDDSYKYGIVGGLQLWILLAAQIALLVTHIAELNLDSRISAKHGYKLQRTSHKNKGFDTD